MDHSSFDRIARLLGGATTRRAGIGAVVASLASASLAGDIAAKARRIEPAGPCGDGSGKDNRCTKGSECCTGYCRKGKNGKTGRCRCLKRGKTCTQNRNCCGSMPCTDGKCGADDPPVPEVCLVCASGCPYSTVTDALAGVAAGATIEIDTGTYDADLVVSKDVTLTNCNGSAVTLRNSTATGRTIVFDPTAVTLPTLTITNLTITKSDASGSDGGGISGAGHLVLDGTTVIENCWSNSANNGYGGGVLIGSGNDPDASSFLMTGNAIIQNCQAESGAAVYVNDYVKSAVFNGNAKVVNNVPTYPGVNGGGAVYVAYETVVTLDANVELSGNATTVANGGAIYFYGYGAGSTLTINAGVKITGNSAVSGGGVYAQSSAGTKTIASGTVTDNTPDNCAGNVSC
jgi:hypothetical protein